MRQIDEQRQKHNLPIQPTSFVGRTAEVAEITHFLADPTCRLLTLVGPGGIGKTRLAIQVGTEMLAHFAGGVIFVPLQPLRSANFMVPAIADALQFTLRGQEDPARQLFNHLHGKEYLLILDNFEHLLAAGVDLIANLLAACPTIKLLITSQEVLNLQEEWLYHVPGMSLPTELPAGSQDGSAVQLFERRARRVRRDFLLADEKAQVLRICRLVEGSPLAIELAASWTKTLTCQAIADEIEQNINFLTSNLRNVPERQRSMRAVFDYSWQLLSPEERDVFMRLSVFRGGFQREAAARVAGAALGTLSLLVDKSLLRLNADGRYQIHEVLRQCAAEQLAQSAENVTQFYDLHCAYYADFLRQRWPHLSGGRQRETMAEIRAELENVRLAWQWAVELAKVEEMEKASQTLDGFYQFQSRFVEAAAAFEQAVNSLAAQEATPEIERALARQLIFLSWYCIRLGDFQKAQNLIERSQALYQAHHFIHSPGLGTDPLGPLSILALVRGDYTTAMELGERSRQINESKNDLQNLAFAHYILAGAYSGRGQYEQARHHARQAYELSHTSEDRWFMAYCLIEWGNIARAMAAYDEAKQHFQASYALRKEFDDPEGVAVALHHLGKIAVIQKDYTGARQLYQQSVTIYRQINDRGGLAASLGGLGVVAGLEDDYRTARQYFGEALQIAVDMQFVTLTLSILIDIAELLGRTGRAEHSIELLAFIHRHPAGNRETQERAKQYLARYQPDLSPDVFVEATQRGTIRELVAIVATIEAEFVTSAALESSLDPGTAEKFSTPASAALVEPLTLRELEVLRHMATGLTNQEIAQDLIISVGTVKWYTGQIYGKLNVGNRTQAVARARELELLA